MREMKDVCEEWGVQIDTKPRASLSVRTWSSYTKQSLREKFPGCQVRVAGDYLLYMSASNKNHPLFEYLLQEDNPFVIETEWTQSNADFWQPAAVGKKFGEMEVKVTSLIKDEKEKTTVKSFFKFFAVIDFDCPSKIGDFPE